ncbi:hypothetical protein Tco_1348161, partial [Tanacetum coccineum]
MKDPSQRVTLENDSTRIRSCMSTSEKEQNKHAIAVSAQATVAIASLTSDGRDTLFSGREKWAATKIHMQALLRAQLVVRSKRAELAVRYQLAVQREICHGEST